jgi:hypothetical protein
VVETLGPTGKALVITRSATGAVSRRHVFDAAPPRLPGFEPAPAFSF